MASTPSTLRPAGDDVLRPGRRSVDLGSEVVHGGLDPALDLAFERAMSAYAVARRLVYDLHPSGVPSKAELTREQRAALQRQRDAELALDTLRRSRHHLLAGGGPKAAPVPDVGTSPLFVGDE